MKVDNISSIWQKGSAKSWPIEIAQTASAQLLLQTPKRSDDVWPILTAPNNWEPSTDVLLRQKLMDWAQEQEAGA
jgi:hypothetical protein